MSQATCQQTQARTATTASSSFVAGSDGKGWHNHDKNDKRQREHAVDINTPLPGSTAWWYTCWMHAHAGTTSALLALCAQPPFPFHHAAGSAGPRKAGQRATVQIQHVWRKQNQRPNWRLRSAQHHGTGRDVRPALHVRHTRNNVQMPSELNEVVPKNRKAKKNKPRRSCKPSND